MLTKRRRKRMDKDASDKHILWMYREERRRWKARREASWIKLDKPVKIGYERTYRLKPEIARSVDAAFWEEMLELVNNRIFARKKIYLLRPLRKRAKRKLAKWKWEPRLNLNELSPAEYNTLHARKKKYFYYTIGKHGKVCYRFSKGIYFEEYIRPVYSDKIHVGNLNLLNEYRQIRKIWAFKIFMKRNEISFDPYDDAYYNWYKSHLRALRGKHHLKNLQSIKKYGYELTNQGCEFRGPDFFNPCSFQPGAAKTAFLLRSASYAAILRGAA